MTDDFESGATVTIADLLDQHVQTSEDMQRLQRTRWINQILLQLISARIDAGVTQARLAERMGRHQSAIGRLERSDDIKLSTLFDYLSAVGRVPAGEIYTVSELEAFAQLTRAAGSKTGQDLPTFPDWLRRTQRAAKYEIPRASVDAGRPASASGVGFASRSVEQESESEPDCRKTLAA